MNLILCCHWKKPKKTQLSSLSSPVSSSFSLPFPLFSFPTVPNDLLPLDVLGPIVLGPIVLEI